MDDAYKAYQDALAAHAAATETLKATATAAIAKIEADRDAAVTGSKPA